MPARKTIPITDHTTPTCPQDVPAEVAAEFARVVDLLGSRVKAEDGYAVLMFAQAWHTWRQATADVAAQGRVVMSGGTAIANPALTVAAQAHQQILSLSRELGLSPAQRKRLKIDKRQRESADWFTAEAAPDA